MADFLVYINMTAPYASGKGRRTVWRGKARVNALGPAEAIQSQSFESIGKTVLHSDHKAICILGDGWEVHIMCPGALPHCKACGAVNGKASGFCRDCSPLPHTKGVREEGELELKPRYEKLAQNRLKPIGDNKEKRRRPGRRKKKAVVRVQDVDLEAAAQQLFDDF